jgi:uncharacterized integral membrane protein (TIGR00698 family)
MAWILTGLAGAALLLSQLPLLAGIGLSALPLAVLIGALYGNSPLAAKPTVRSKAVLAFAQQKLLRLGIILFGFNLSLSQLLIVGWPALVADAIMITVILTFGIWFGIRCLKMTPELASLASIGSAVCGAAAIMAANPVVKGRDQDVTLAVALVVVFGTLAMFTYPLLFAFSGLDPAWFGIYIGSTVHEVAQAVAAGQAMGAETMEYAVVTKLVRVMMLAPVVLILARVMIRLRQNDSSDATKAPLPIPWFVFGFMLAAGIGSLGWLPSPVITGLQWLAQVALALAMVALGIKARWCDLKTAGWRPLVHAGVLFVLLLGGGLGVTSVLVTLF